MLRIPILRRCGAVLTILAGLAALAAHSASAAPPSIDDFLSFAGVNDVALSPDGKYLAIVQDDANDRHSRALMVYRIEGGKLALHKGSKFTNTRAFNLTWANESRLLVTLQKYDPETGSSLEISSNRRSFKWEPPQILALDADLKNPVFLLEKEHKFKYTFDKSQFLHRLPDDPDHVLMAITEIDRDPSFDVFKVNIHDGKAERVERGNPYTYRWMVDWEGNVRLRVDSRNFYTNYNARATVDGEWFEIARYRNREIPTIEPLAFSSDPNLLYVVARHKSDKRAIFEYNIRERKLGRLVFSHPEVDVTTAIFTYSDHRLAGFRYVIHKPRAEYVSAEYKDFDRKLEKAFGAQNFAVPVTRTRDEKLMVIGVTGPRNPGSYYLFDTETNRAQLLGHVSTKLKPEQMGAMKPVSYQARDGMKITAYFTTPPSNPSKPPLVVIPHGGPEARDYLEWDTRVQFLATRGYAVLQPNFRGSDGYGLKFVEAGHEQWGLKMQDDITDGVRHLVSQGLVDPRRICIAGWSYGGYAALAGAAFTPDLYKCAVSVNGISDLYGQMVTERRERYAFDYWKKYVGDPGDSEDAKRMKATSPARVVENIKVPILLIAGEEDGVVPVIQSREMADVLKDAGKPHKYIEFEKEGHSFSAYKNRKRVYKELESFLARHIGRRATAAPSGSGEESAAH